MSERFSSIGIQDFLKDFRNQSTTEVYESGKEKEEIIQIAKAKMGIDLKNNSDLAGFKTIYTFSDIANGNKARLPKELLLKALPTIIGKPVNINHIRNYVVGYYIDYRYIEAENKVIAYGIFFKSNFGNEWSEAKELLKSKQLGTSHEIWCPRDKRKYLPDGTYEAHALEFAGGALIYRNKEDWQNPGRKIDTAYKGCDVLELAKNHMDKNFHSRDLITASLNILPKKSYRPDDLIVANDAQDFLKRSEAEIKNKVDAGLHKQYLEPTATPIPTVKCENCGAQWDAQNASEQPCKECKAIVDRNGKMVYPPQVISFNFREPMSGSSNWLLISDTPDSALIKNIDSNKVYELTFAKNPTNDELMNKLHFVYMGSASCPQCGKVTSFSTSSGNENYGINCPRCELHYTQDIKKQTMYRKIKAYQDVTDTYKNSKKQDGDPTVKDTQELEVSSVVEEPIKNLEVASIDTTTVNLELSSLELSTELESLNDELVVAKTLTNEERSSLNDSDFLVVKKINDKTIRKYPVHDAAHVRSALSYLGQEANRQSLENMGVSVKDVLDHLHQKAKQFGIDQNMEQASLAYVARAKKLVQKTRGKMSQLRHLNSASALEIAKIKSDSDKKIDFYKTNAAQLIKRREALGRFGEELSDEKIMDDTVYAKAKLEKENALLKASLANGNSIVGEKTPIGKSDARTIGLKKEIDEKAFKSWMT